MALFRRRSKGRRGAGISPFVAGFIAIAIITVVTGWVFTKFNPFANPYEFRAMFATANNLKAKSPVRIAGVNVGEVTEVKPVEDGSGAAMVKMKMTDAGLPIHEDAELKIRPRIFLEGNFFVDLQPGSPSAPELERDKTIPINQTAAPVQFGQLLTALQSDTREDLRTFLSEYSLKALKGEGARGFNRSIKYWEGAYKNTALANQALLGTEPGDLGRVLKGQGDVAAALARNPERLKSFVSDFNTTAAAFAREDDNLQATIPALRDVLRVGEPALASLNRSLPSLSAFARDATPGVRSSLPTINATLPLIRQLRGLFSEAELRGLVADLRPTIPALARLNRDSIPFLEQNRQLSSCTNNVLLPFAKTPIPDPDFAADGNSGHPFYKQSSRALVGLGGESRIFDANSSTFRVLGSLGPVTLANRSEGSTFFSQSDGQQGVRPDRPARQPVFRPGIPCETQEPPDLNAPLGPGDTAVNVVPDPNINPITGEPFLPRGVASDKKGREGLSKEEFERFREQALQDVLSGKLPFDFAADQGTADLNWKHLTREISQVERGETKREAPDRSDEPQVGDDQQPEDSP